MSTTNQPLADALRDLIEEARLVSEDVARDVEAVLVDAAADDLGEDDVRRLLDVVVRRLRDNAVERGDDKTAAALSRELEDLINKTLALRARVVGHDGHRSRSRSRRVQLGERHGIAPAPVRPTPKFHGHEIPMNAGFIDINDIPLWLNNERLDVHIGQFAQKTGRLPSSEELLGIMLSEAQLPGVTEADEFKILDLARSIAQNGVQRPPIIDLDGSLLDGNRRVAACHFLLRSGEFSAEEKQRARWLYVWQLTEHSAPEDRERVVVGLNFEPDYKQPWPEYVEARKVFDEWQMMLALERRTPSPQRVRDMKRELSHRFALGPKIDVISRYINMVQWANDFEDYNVLERNGDEFEVKHRARKYFQYFAELARGVKPGGVAYTLEQDTDL